jgi:hypothetical protein
MVERRLRRNESVLMASFHATAESLLLSGSHPGQTATPVESAVETPRPATGRHDMADDKALRQHLVKLLKGGDAHADFEHAIADFPAELRGKTPKGAEHSPWELLEHLRIAQQDILDFSINPDYKEKEWPKEYWPATDAPPDPKAWDRSINAYCEDLKALCALAEDPKTDLFAKIPHGDGQTILREILVVADHNSYHLGQLVLLRRLLGAWN